MRRNEPLDAIAITGMACRFPGGVSDPDSYWALLTSGGCAISEIPPERWSLGGFFDPAPDNPARSYSKWGGFLSDIRGFDAEFFGLSEREAEAMDPQQRLLLEVACEAAWNARTPLNSLKAMRTGVFIGVSNVDYGLMQRYRTGTGDIQAGTGTALSIIANRISNRLDLSGPSLGVDTACSSSITALDMALRSLRSGACDAALVGGVNILLDPRMFITFCRAHMLSPTGRIAAFDAAADGFVRGEGVGVVLLRRQSEAEAEGAPVHALIKASAVNQDGATGTLTAPNSEAQRTMLRAILEAGGVLPDAIAYVEAHGTGTALGDPVEAGAIGAVIGQARGGAPLPIGSVKANIGHLEPAAGIAGLIKAALVLAKREIPPSIHFEKPNPRIAFNELRLEVPRQTAPLPDLPGGTHVLVNSFGFGGTNACALLAAYEPKTQAVRPSARADSAAKPGPLPVPLSASSPEQLRAFAARLAEALAPGGTLAYTPLPEIAAALALSRDHLRERAVILATGPANLRAKLEALSQGRNWPRAEKWDAPQIILGCAGKRPKLAFTMTGQGGQFWNMGRELLEHHRVFRRFVEKFDALFAPRAGWSVIEALSADEATTPLHDPAITPAAMFALQAGLAAVWREAGITPDIVFGHSFGEVTAAYLAGGIALTDVAHLVNHRGLIRHEIDRFGAMAAIGLGAAELAPFMPGDGSIEIGAYNAPTQVTVSGETHAIDALIARLEVHDPNILARKLDLDFAWHSSWLEPGEQSFKKSVGPQPWRVPDIPAISTVTGELETRFDTDYWWRNLRQPVRFEAATKLALDLGVRAFIELGPHRTLSSPIAACAAEKGLEVLTISTLNRRQSNFESFAVGVGELYGAGFELDWRAILGADGRGIDLPALPWQHRELWLEPEEARAVLKPAQFHALLGRREPGPVPRWVNEISLGRLPFLAGHKIGGDILFPAAGYIEMMRAAAVQIFAPEAGGVELEDIRFPEALALTGDDEIMLRSEYMPERRRLRIYSRLRGGAQDWTLRAEARVLVRPLALAPVALPEPPAWLDSTEFYALAERLGYGYGPDFQRVRRFCRVTSGAVGEVEAAKGVALTGVILDPCQLDGCLQLLIAAGGAADRFLPAEIARIQIAGAADGPMRARFTVENMPDGGLRADADILDAAGQPLMRIDGLIGHRLAGRREAGAGPEAGGAYYHEVWEDLPESAATEDGAGDGVWLVLGADRGAVSAALATSLRQAGLNAHLTQIAAGGLSEPQAYAQALETAQTQEHLAGILYAVALDGMGALSPEQLASTAEAQVQALTAFGRAIAGITDKTALGQIVVATRNASAVSSASGGKLDGLAARALIGLARTIAVECPEAAIRLVDLDEAAIAAPQALIQLLRNKRAETEAAFRSGAILVPRLKTLASGQIPLRPVPLQALRPEQDFTLRQSRPGLLDRLEWRLDETRAPGPGEIKIATAAVGLNFRDVMAANGMLPRAAEPDDAARALGLEYAGEVVAVGPDAGDWQVGERVFGMARGSLRRFILANARRAYRIPARLSPLEAAALPSAYLTAHYALNHIGRMRAGERVLIHAGTGGLGLAAIALARMAGAEVLATAGSPEKRDYLQKLGIAHVMDSRRLDFADEVMRVTEERGVDLILNALPGAYIDKGLACLGPYGRFLELGKRDVYADSAVGLKALRRNASLHVIDVAALLEDRPDLVRALMSELGGWLEAGTLAPLPLARFGAADITEAFQFFAQARHIGKIVIDFDDPMLRVAAPDGAARIDPRGGYLVTGGTSGFGLAAGLWLAQAEAGRVVLASRSGTVSPEALERIGQLRARGAEIEVQALDVRDQSAVEAGVRALAAADKPLKGIIHAAVAYADALLPQMTSDKVHAALAPKLAGGWALTRAVLSAKARLDFFLSLSSLAQVLGWAGQANYTAANAFLEGLSRYQRAVGIPGICLNLGALGQSGFVARSRAMSAYLESTGMHGFDDEAALAGLAQALGAEPAALTFASADWARLKATQPVLARAARLQPLMAQGEAATENIRAVLARAGGAERQARAEALVRSELAKVLRVDEAALTGYASMADAGLDSLSSFELRVRVESALGLPVPLARFSQAATIPALGTLLCDLAGEAERGQQQEQGQAQEEDAPVAEDADAPEGEASISARSAAE